VSFVAIGLFVLACGWNVYRLFLPTRSAAIRVEGHPQYFGAALAAGYVGFLAIFLHAAALKHDGYKEAIHSLANLAPKASDDDKARTASLSLVLGKLTIDRAEIAPRPASAPAVANVKAAETSPREIKADTYETALGIGLWSAILAIFLPVFLNAPFFRNARLRLLAGRKNFNEIEEAAVEAFERQTSLLITLNSGKVYVGFPSEFDPNGDEAEWLRIWPIASGYRTRKGKLRLTTSYEEAYTHISSDEGGVLSLNDFEVLLPLSGIASVQRFKLRFYLDHFATEGASSSEDDDFIDALIREGLVKPQHLISGEDLVAAGETSGWDLPPEGALAPVVVAGTASPVVPPPNPWEKQVPDLWLRFLKWSYHGCLTGAVAFLPFDTSTSAWLAFLGFSALTFTVEPADEVLSDFFLAIRDYGRA
jgi:hypothetical protein